METQYSCWAETVRQMGLSLDTILRGEIDGVQGGQENKCMSYLLPVIYTLSC